MKITNYICDYCGVKMEYKPTRSVHLIKDGFNLEIDYNLCDSCYNMIKEDFEAQHRNVFRNYIINGLNESKNSSCDPFFN